MKKQEAFGENLSSSEDVITKELIQSYLKEDNKEFNINVYNSIDSTNLEAKRNVEKVGELRNLKGELTKAGKKLNKSVFIAETQTSGKGRMGREFVSKEYSGAYFSLLYSPAKTIDNPAILTAIAAVAVCESIEENYNISAKIKWVNDIFINGKKIAGILTEGLLNQKKGILETAIIGIGINVKKMVFPESISKIAASIEDFSDNKRNISRNKLIADICSKLFGFYDEIERSGSSVIKNLMKSYRDRSVLIGKSIVVNPLPGLEGDMYNAIVKNIDDNGFLVVETENHKEIVLNSGEVTLRSDKIIC